MLAKIRYAVRDASHRIDREIVALLDEVVFEAGELCARQDGREVDRAVAELGIEVAVLAIHVFDVPHGEAAGVALEEVERRPGGGMSRPEEIELQLHERRIGVSNQNVIAALTVVSDELEIVVVIREEKSRF